MYNYQNRYTNKIIKESKKIKFGGTTSNTLSGSLNKIIKEISEETGIPKNEVVKVVKSIFKFTQIVLSKITIGFFGKLTSNNLPIVKLKYFGKFTPSKYRILKMVHNLEKKRQNAER